MSTLTTYFYIFIYILFMSFKYLLNGQQSVHKGTQLYH